MEKRSAVSLRVLIAAVAGPQQFSDNRKSWLARAARVAGISFRSVKAVFYGEIDDPQHPCVRLLRHAAVERAKSLADRYETIARTMDTTDPDFFRADVLGLLDVARVLRELDSGTERPSPAGGSEDCP